MYAMTERLRAASKSKLRLHASVVVARPITAPAMPEASLIGGLHDEPHHLSQFVPRVVPLAETLSNRLQTPVFRTTGTPMSRVPESLTVSASVNDGGGPIAEYVREAPDCASLLASMSAAGLCDTSISWSASSAGGTGGQRGGQSVAQADVFSIDDAMWPLSLYSSGRRDTGATDESVKLTESNAADAAAVESAKARRAVWRPVTVPARLVRSPHGRPSSLAGRQGAGTMTAADYIAIMDDAVAAAEQYSDSAGAVKHIHVPDAPPEVVYRIPQESVAAFVQRDTSANAPSSPKFAKTRGALRNRSRLVTASTVDVFHDEMDEEMEELDYLDSAVDLLRVVMEDVSRLAVSSPSASRVARVPVSAVTELGRSSLADLVAFDGRRGAAHDLPVVVRDPCSSSAGGASGGGLGSRVTAVSSTPRIAARTRWSEDAMQSRTMVKRPPKRQLRSDNKSTSQKLASRRATKVVLPFVASAEAMVATPELAAPSRSPSRRVGMLLGFKDEKTRHDRLYSDHRRPATVCSAIARRLCVSHACAQRG